MTRERISSGKHSDSEEAKIQTVKIRIIKNKYIVNNKYIIRKLFV